MSCLFSPSAPQVENYALDAVSIPSNVGQETLMLEKQAGPAPRDVRPRTRSIASVERLVIPSSLEISDSEEEHDRQDRTSYFVLKPFGASKSVAATKKVTGTARRRIPFTPSKIQNYSSDRIVRYTGSTSAMTPASSSKKPRTTSTPPSQINLAPRIGSANEDDDDSSVDGPPELISSSEDNGDM
jgi:hypothetical protein